MKKPTRIVTGPAEVRKILECPSTCTREEAIRSIHIQNKQTTHRPMIGNLTDDEFDALALLNCYYWTDMCWPGVQRKSERLRLFDRLSRILPEENRDCDLVKEQYDLALETWAAEQLPEGWEPAFDLWGAKCIAKLPGWLAPKQGTLFCGDNSRHYMTLESSAALRQYTERILKDIKDGRITTTD